VLAILMVILGLGYGHSWLAVWVLPHGFLVGLTFGAFGLVMNSLAPAFDFFTYFFTLVLTPMLLLSGVFFPLAQLPEGIRRAAMVLPLAHAVELIRAAMLGRTIDSAVVHLCVLAAYAIVPFFVCAVLFRRRLMR